jgi:hypothetical protein
VAAGVSPRALIPPSRRLIPLPAGSRRRESSPRRRPTRAGQERTRAGADPRRCERRPFRRPSSPALGPRPDPVSRPSWQACAQKSIVATSRLRECACSRTHRQLAHDASRLIALSCSRRGRLKEEHRWGEQTRSGERGAGPGQMLRSAGEEGVRRQTQRGARERARRKDRTVGRCD